MDDLDIYEFVSITRDASAPSFTANHPMGTHPAWKFKILDTGREFGPYWTRGEAESAAKVMLKAEADHVRHVLQRAVQSHFENQGGNDPRRKEIRNERNHD